MQMCDKVLCSKPPTTLKTGSPGHRKQLCVEDCILWHLPHAALTRYPGKGREKANSKKMKQPQN